MQSHQKHLGLVADIGGTNGRFALVSQTGSRFELHEQRQYSSSRFERFSELVNHYLTECGYNEPPRAVLAVAGPVEGNSCRLTNGGLLIDGAQLQNDGVFSACLVLNDFAALAYSLPFLQDTDVMQIGPKGKEKSGPKLVVGPGTGLGAAFLMPVGSSYVVLEGEGGHMSFAPVDEVETELLAWFSKRYGRVSLERILSGTGLEDLYLALGELAGDKYEKQTAAQIMTKGLGGEPDQRAALLRFCAILGSYTGDLALTGGCWNGVYIGGGIAPRMSELLLASEFGQRFEAKGRFAKKLGSVPRALITHPTAALLGAAFRLSEIEAK